MGVRGKKDYMEDGTFAELVEAAEQALAYERGAREGYRVMQVESPKSPRKAPAGEAVSPKSKPEHQRKHKHRANR